MIVKSKNTELFVRIIFSVILFLFFFKSVFISLEINESLRNITSGVLNALIVLILLISTFLFTLKEKIVLFLLVSLFVINKIMYDNIYLFGYIILYCILLLSNRIEWHKLVGLLLVVNVLVVCCIIPFLFLADRYSMLDDRFGERLTFGFHNPNTVSQYLISLYTLLLLFVFEYIRSSGIKFTIILFITIMMLFVVYLTGSRTGLLLTALLGFSFTVSLFFKIRIVRRPYFCLFFATVTMLLCFIQFYLSHAYISLPIAQQLNGLLSGRVWFSSLLLDSYWPMPIFHGIDISAYLPIDFFYVAYFYNLGLVVGVFFILLFFRKLMQQRLSLPMCIALWVALAITTTEYYFTIPLYNVGLFLVFSCRSDSYRRGE